MCIPNLPIRPNRRISVLWVTGQNILGGGGGVGVCGQNICYHAAAFCDSLSNDMQHDHVLKKLNFDILGVCMQNIKCA